MFELYTQRMFTNIVTSKKNVLLNQGTSLLIA